MIVQSHGHVQKLLRVDYEFDKKSLPLEALLEKLERCGMTNISLIFNGKTQVEILAARELLPSDAKIRTSCQILYEDACQVTPICHDSVSPIWNHSVLFSLGSNNSSVLRVECREEGQMPPDNKLGIAEIDVTSKVPKAGIIYWSTLCEWRQDGNFQSLVMWLKNDTALCDIVGSRGLAGWVSDWHWPLSLVFYFS